MEHDQELPADKLPEAKEAVQDLCHRMNRLIAVWQEENKSFMRLQLMAVGSVLAHHAVVEAYAQVKTQEIPFTDIDAHSRQLYKKLMNVTFTTIEDLKR